MIFKYSVRQESIRLFVNKMNFMLRKMYLFVIMIIFVPGTGAVCNTTGLYDCYQGDPSQNISYKAAAAAGDANNCRFYQWLGECIKPYSYNCYGVPDFDGILDEYNLMIIRFCSPPAKACNLSLVEQCTRDILDPALASIDSSDLRNFRPMCGMTLGMYRSCLDNAEKDCDSESRFYTTKQKLKELDMVCNTQTDCDLYMVHKCYQAVRVDFLTMTTLVPSTNSLSKMCSKSAEFLTCTSDVFKSCDANNYFIPLNSQKEYFTARSFAVYYELTCQRYNQELVSMVKSCTKYLRSPFFVDDKKKVDQCNSIQPPNDGNGQLIQLCKTTEGILMNLGRDKELTVPYSSVSLYLLCMSKTLSGLCSPAQVHSFTEYAGSLRRQTYDILYKTSCQTEFQALTTQAPTPIPTTTPIPAGECDLKQLIECHSMMHTTAQDMMMSFIPTSTHLKDVCGTSSQYLACIKPLLTLCQGKILSMSSFEALIELLTMQSLMVQVEHACVKSYHAMKANAKYCNDKLTSTHNAGIQACMSNPPSTGTDPCDAIEVMVNDCMAKELKAVCDAESLPVALEYISALQRAGSDAIQGTQCQAKYEASRSTTRAPTPVPVSTPKLTPKPSTTPRPTTLTPVPPVTTPSTGNQPLGTTLRDISKSYANGFSAFCILTALTICMVL